MRVSEPHYEILAAGGRLASVKRAAILSCQTGWSEADRLVWGLVRYRTLDTVGAVGRRHAIACPLAQGAIGSARLMAAVRQTLLDTVSIEMVSRRRRRFYAIWCGEVPVRPNWSSVERLPVVEATVDTVVRLGGGFFHLRILDGSTDQTSLEAEVQRAAVLTGWKRKLESEPEPLTEDQNGEQLRDGVVASRGPRRSVEPFCFNPTGATSR